MSAMEDLISFDEPQKGLKDQLKDLKEKYSESLSREEALQLALEAADLNLKLLKLARGKDEKAQLRSVAERSINEVERIKKSDVWDAQQPQALWETLEPQKLYPAPPPKPTTVDRQPVQTNSQQAPSKPVVAEPGPVNKPKSSKPTPEPKKLVLQAPRSKKDLVKSERDVLSKGARVNGMKFPECPEALSHSEFVLKDDHERYVDNKELGVSREQRKYFLGWEHPDECINALDETLPASSDPSSALHQVQPVMDSKKLTDLVQDAATDCSIVASLSAAMSRTERGFDNVLANTLSPRDSDTNSFIFSENGKYIVRLNFNGCWRKVVIDDRLPNCSPPRFMYVIDRKNPGLLWPALLEKAYLKIYGTYDFSGSNSCVDLWTLIGWVPEEVFMTFDDSDPSRLWSRIYTAFSHGDVLLTAGTGKLSPETEEALGLVGEHDYSILDLKEQKGRHLVLLKNTWVSGTTWKGYQPKITSSDKRSSGSNDSGSDSEGNGASDAADSETEKRKTGISFVAGDEDNRTGTFWLDFDDVLQNFETLYLSWNPGLFRHRQDYHFEWNLGPEGKRSPKGLLIDNPQFIVRSQKGGVIWVLLTKHFRDDDAEIHPRTEEGAIGYMNLVVFKGKDKQMYLFKNASVKSWLVEGPQSLQKLELEPEELPCIIVPAELDLLPLRHNFTLSIFSEQHATLDRAPRRYARRITREGSWTHDTAGGNTSSPTFSRNPQFALTVKSSQTFLLILETPTPGLHVSVKVLYGQGLRMYAVTKRDIILDSGAYRKNFAYAELATPLDAGTYTIICSTFDAGQLGDFTLHLDSDFGVDLTPIAKEGAGRILTRLRDLSFPKGATVVAAPIMPQRRVKANFVARYVEPLKSVQAAEESAGSAGDSPGVSSGAGSQSPIQLRLELGTGPTKRVLISSSKGTFSDSPSGVRTDDVELDPSMVRKKDMWLVVQRMALPGTQRIEERLGIEVWCDVPDALEPGVWRDFGSA